MAWKRRLLRGKVVYARVKEDGALEAEENDRVEIVYSLKEGAKSYRAAVRNLAPLADDDDQILEGPAEVTPAGDKAGESGGKVDDKKRAAKKNGGNRPVPEILDEDALIIYTDGACSKNPGPMGAGAVILDRGKRAEISEFLGEGTNNIAELSAIMLALQAIDKSERGRLTVVHTDSTYCIGVLEKNWKAKANVSLILEIRKLISTFEKIEFVKVKGHAGIPENERCDELAVQAVERGKSER